MYDTHFHIFCRRHIDASIHFGRHEFSSALWPVVDILAKCEKLNDALEAVDRIVDHLPVGVDISGALDVVRLFYMDPYDQLSYITSEWRKLGILGGFVLIPAIGDYRRATREITAAAHSFPEVRVFAPWDCSDIPGVSGIKLYPALEGYERVQKACYTAESKKMPIVAHCSPGGIRASGCSLAAAKARNSPWWLSEALHAGLSLRVVLAHAGGRDAWVRARITGAETAIDRILRDTMPGLSEYPTSWVGVDTAYHEAQDADDYRLALSRLPGWYAGRVLPGSDWPLHMPEYSYQAWADATRRAWAGWDQDFSLAVQSFLSF